MKLVKRDALTRSTWIAINNIRHRLTVMDENSEIG